MKNEESKKAREVGRTMDGPKTTGAVENGMKPTITLKLRVALNKSVQYRSTPPLMTRRLRPKRRKTEYQTPVWYQRQR